MTCRFLSALLLVVSTCVLSQPIVDGSGHWSLRTRIQAASTDEATDVVVSQLNRLLAIRYSIEFETEQFERAVRDAAAQPAAKQPFNANNNPAYRRLLALRVANDGIAQSIAQIYEDSLRTAIDNRSSRAEANKAVAVIATFDSWFHTLPEEDRLQVLQLAERLEYVRSKVGGTTVMLTKGLGVRPLSDFVGIDPRQLETRFQALRQLIDGKATRYGKEAESLGIEFEPSAAPSPSSDPIEPSIGPQGNVWGTEFGPGTFVLSFDDGPDPKLTPQIVGLLNAYHDPVNPRAPATFFRRTDHALAFPQTVAATRAAGFQMDNHSWTHPRFDKLDESSLDHEIVESTLALRKELGYEFRFFRCPYGICMAPPVPAARQRIADQHLVHAYWNIDSTDYDHPGEPRRVAHLVIDQIRAAGRGLILMHDVHQTTVDALPIVLDWIRNQNENPGAAFRIRLVDLSQAVDEVNARRKRP